MGFEVAKEIAYNAGSIATTAAEALAGRGIAAAGKGISSGTAKMLAASAALPLVVGLAGSGQSDVGNPTTHPRQAEMLQALKDASMLQ
jgi:hypothetical protein